MRKTLCLLAFFCLFVLQASAQMLDKPFMSWDEFVQTYLNDTDSGEDNAEIDEEQRDWLERLSQQPWQLNRIERNDLLRLPFLDEEQADSILSYRQKRHGFLSLGELQLIKGIDYYTRCYLSLFVRCDSAALPDEAYIKQRKTADKLRRKFRQGHHELETRLDVPLYKREGYKVPDKPTKTNYYYGNALHHVIRYAYNCKREVMYGLTMEKDAGEPVVKNGFYPYDYLSGYFLLRPKQKAWGLVFGDYNVFSGCGLLFGRPFYGGREQLARNMRRTSTLFKAHTSASESNYFRGAAVAYGWKSIDVLTFLSYRRLDANYDGGDSVRTILKTGLHRTISEIDNRRNLGCLTFGAHAGYEKQRWSLALDGYMAHYDHTVCPKERYYNKYYFRGRTTGALSATYNVFLSKFKTHGELASDNKGHISTIHTLGYQFSKKIGINAQWRFFTPAFVSVYGSAMQQGSHVANEQGCLLLVQYLPIKRCEMSGYVDFFRFPKPTYQAFLTGSKGMELSFQTLYAVSGACNLLFRYRLKSKQYTFTNNETKYLEYRNKHQLRLASLWKYTKYEVNVQADGSYYCKQTGDHSLGWMLSSRATWRPSKRFNLKAFASVFFTDDSQSNLYAYEPQLLHVYSFSAFSYHGMREVVLVNWNIFKTFTFSFRFSSTHYFNKSGISSRLDLIKSSWKNDVSIQLRYVI